MRRRVYTVDAYCMRVHARVCCIKLRPTPLANRLHRLLTFFKITTVNFNCQYCFFCSEASKDPFNSAALLLRPLLQQFVLERVHSPHIPPPGAVALAPLALAKHTIKIVLSGCVLGACSTRVGLVCGRMQLWYTVHIYEERFPPCYGRKNPHYLLFNNSISYLVYYEYVKNYADFESELSQKG